MISLWTFNCFYTNSVYLSVCSTGGRTDGKGGMCLLIYELLLCAYFMCSLLRGHSLLTEVSFPHYKIQWLYALPRQKLAENEIFTAFCQHQSRSYIKIERTGQRSQKSDDIVANIHVGTRSTIKKNCLNILFLCLLGINLQQTCGIFLFHLITTCIIF